MVHISRISSLDKTDSILGPITCKITPQRVMGSYSYTSFQPHANFIFFKLFQVLHVATVSVSSCILTMLQLENSVYLELSTTCSSYNLLTFSSTWDPESCGKRYSKDITFMAECSKAFHSLHIVQQSVFVLITVLLQVKPSLMMVKS